MADSETTGTGWRYVAASVKGRSHEQNDLPCQDASAVKVAANGLLIAVVADGAGSAARAEEGSAIAVERALTFLSCRLGGFPEPSDELIQTAIARAFEVSLEAIHRRAEEVQAPVSQFHTTLLCAIADDRRVIVGHIGDGVAVVNDDADRLETVALPEHGEYVNFTYFLTQLPAMPERLHVRTYTRPVAALALSTDGLLDVAFSDPYGQCEPWEAFFRPLFARVRDEDLTVDLTAKLTALLRSSKIRSQTGDDVTLVIAVRTATVAVPPSVDTPDVLDLDTPDVLDLADSVTVDSSMDSDPDLLVRTPNHSDEQI